MNEGQKREIEQDILINVIRDEIDFISYVDVDTEKLHTIVTNESSDVMPPLDGCYTEINLKNIPCYVHPEDRAYCAKILDLSNIQEELKKKSRISLTYRLLCGGKYRRKELRIYEQCDDRRTLVFVRRDVTDTYEEEQRQKERLYHALQEAKRANQEKNNFLERMSHEIRTPMNSIVGLVYLSRTRMEDKKQILENLDKIDQSAQFLLSFVDDILNMSQVESGNTALNEEENDFAVFLEELEQVARENADKKKIHFSIAKRGNFDPFYCFDADKLRKALQNVLQNAIKFTPVEGRVEFIVELLRETDEKATFRFEIRDNGCGIDEAFMPHIFEPFERECSETATLTGGSGLGLAIARNNIEYMGGKIDAYSEKGNGATFVVTVKLKRVQDLKQSLRKQKKSRDLEYDFSGKRILLAEDNEINIEITENILTHKNFEVEVVRDGKACVEKFMEHEAGYYNAILMDIRMPVMDGLTAARQIRVSEHADHGTIPIIAMTANVFDQDVRKSLEAGMDAHLNKPVDIRQMYDLLDTVIYE